MSLEAKIDELIPALGKLVEGITDLKAIMASAGGAAPATETKAPAKRGATAKAAAPEPKYDADQVKAKFDEVKTPAVMPALKKIIADAGYGSLAELLTHPEKFDEVYAALEGVGEPATAEDDL